MNWSSVKNLLIAILVAANLFLVYNITRQDRTRSYVSEAEISDAIELLAERGFNVPQRCVPIEKFKTPVYESLYNAEYYTQTVESLTGSEREMLYTLPNGGISISTKNGVTMEFDNEFAFRYAKFDIPESSAYTEITADTFKEAAEAGTALSASRMKALSSTVSDFLCKRVTNDSALTAQVVDGFVGADGCTYLLADQMLNGHKVYSHYAICVFDDSGLIFATGRWYFSAIDRDYNTELCDQVNILFTDMATLKVRSASTFASDDSQAVPSDTLTAYINDESAELPAVISMSSCYIVYWNADKTALYFIPAWQIDHDNSLTIVYNAANSTVYSSY